MTSPIYCRPLVHSAHTNHHRVSGQANSRIDAEEMLPMIIYATIQSNWHNPHASLAYMGNFGLVGGRQTGRAAYVVTTLHSGIGWVCMHEDTDKAQSGERGGLAGAVVPEGSSDLEAVRNMYGSAWRETAEKDEALRQQMQPAEYNSSMPEADAQRNAELKASLEEWLGVRRALELTLRVLRSEHAS